MAQGFTRGSDKPHGRDVAAQQLESFMLSGADAARDWSAPPEPYQDLDRSITELIEHYGGTKAFAAVTGRSQRQVKRWASTGTDNARKSSLDAIGRANDQINRNKRRERAQGEWGRLADRYGGAKGLAAAAGVSSSTARRWLSGECLPNQQHLANLQKADRRYRVNKTYAHLSLDSGGKPDMPVYIRAAGRVKARGPGKSPLYEYMRQIGIESMNGIGYEMPEDLAATMFDAMHRGNTIEALDVLQRFLSEDYADFPEDSYNVAEEVGFFLDTITGFDLN